MADRFDSSSFAGLSDNEAASRIAGEGYNELPQAKKKTVFSILIGIVKEPMFLLLIACGVLYLLLGDLEGSLMLLGFVFVIIGITLYQENKTERALDALRDLSSPRALVVRNGAQVRIAGREVVRDDVVLLSEGDRVPADAVVLHTVNLSADESLLTGESVPVRKNAWNGLFRAGPAGRRRQPHDLLGLDDRQRAGDRPCHRDRASHRTRKDRKDPRGPRARRHRSAEADRKNRENLRHRGVDALRRGRRRRTESPEAIG